MSRRSSVPLEKTPARRRSRYLASITLVLIGLFSSSILIFQPVPTQSFQYSWNPSSAESSGSFPLDRAHPSSLEVQFLDSCETGQDRDILYTGGLRVKCKEGQPEVELEQKNLTNVHSESGDHIKIWFDSRLSTIHLRNLDSGIEVSEKLEYAEFPRVNQLVAPYPLEDEVSLKLETRPTKIYWDASRILFLIIALFSGFLATLLMDFRKSRYTAKKALFEVTKFWRQHLLVALGLIASAIALPPFFDDGWVIQRTRQSLSNGSFGDFFAHSNAWLPQGFISESLYAFLFAAGIPYAVMRFCVAGILFTSWLLFLKIPKHLNRDLSQYSVWIASSAFVSFSAVNLVSLRAEPIVGLLLAIQVLYLSKYLRYKRWNHFYISGASSALAFSTHQSGFVSLVPLFGLILFSWSVRPHTNWIKSFIPIAGILAAFIGFFFVGYDFVSILDNIRDFSGVYQRSRFNEFNRLAELAGSYTSSARKFSFLLFCLVFIFALISFRASSFKIRALSIILLLMPLGLFATSSKWFWHLGVMVVPLTTLILLLLDLEKTRNKGIRYSFILPILMVAVAMSLSSAGSWGTNDSRQFSWQEFSEGIAGPQTEAYWISAIMLLAFIGFLVDYQKRPGSYRRLGVFTVVAITIFPSLASLGWIVYDSFTPREPGLLSWTMMRQNLQEILMPDSGRCGLLGGAPMYSKGVKPFPVSTLPLWAEERKPMIISDQDSLPWKNLESWTSDGEASEFTSTPIFEIRSLVPKDYVFWWVASAPNQGETVEIELSYLLADSTVHIDRHVKSIVHPVRSWQKVIPQTPETAIAMRISVLGSQGNNISVTAPSEEFLGSAHSILGSNAITFVSPDMVPSIPCVNLPSSQDGKYANFNYVVGTDFESTVGFWFYDYYPAGYIHITEIGIVEEGAPTLWAISFDSAEEVVTSSFSNKE